MKTEMYNSVILFVFSFLIIVAQLFRSLPAGMDPYYYLSLVGTPQPGMPPLFFFLAGLPTVLVAFLSTICIVFLTYKIFTQLGAPNPLIPTLLVGAAPGLTFRMALFEDDLLGVPLGLAAIHLWLKGHRILALALCGISYFVAWRGTMLFAAMLGLSWLAERTKWWWINIPMLGLYFQPNNLVGEEQLGIPFLPIVLMGTLLGFAAWKKVPTFVQVWAFFFLGLGILNAKWLWLAAFPLAFMLYKLYWDQNKEKLYGFVIFAVGVGLFCGSMLVVSSEPTAQQFADIQEMKLYIGEEAFDNSWHFGHWFNYNGMNPINTNLHPSAYIAPPWNTTWAVYHNCSEELVGYDMFKNFTWACLYRLSE